MMKLLEKGGMLLRITETDKSIVECQNKSVSSITINLTHYEEELSVNSMIYFRNEEEKEFFIKNVINECLVNEKENTLIVSTVIVRYSNDNFSSFQQVYLSDDGINNFVEKYISFLDKFNYVNPIDKVYELLKSKNMVMNENNRNYFYIKTWGIPWE